MSKWTIGYGIALTALGVGGFVATGRKQKTALIPVGLGLAAIALGAAAVVPWLKKPALVTSAMVGVVALTSSANALPALGAMMRGEDVERKPAVVARSMLAGLSVDYLAGLALQSRSSQ